MGEQTPVRTSPRRARPLAIVALAAIPFILAHCTTDTIIDGAPGGGGPANPEDASPGLDAGAGEGGPADSATRVVLGASPDLVDFGRVPCGTTSREESVTLTNTSSRSTPWSVEFAGGEPFSLLGPRAGTLAPGASTVLRVAFEAPTGVRSGSGFNRALVVDDGDPSTPTLQISLRGQVSGADLVFANSTIDFGSIDVNGPAATRPIALENRGDLPATVSFDQASIGPFSIGYGSPGATSRVLLPGALPSGITASFDPDTDGLSSASFTLATGAVCTRPAVDLDLLGTGVSSDLRVGEPELDFGLIACGSTAAPRNLVLSNSGTAPVSYTLTLARAAASPFTLSRTSGTLAAGASHTVAVTPRAIPAPGATAIDTASNAFGDVLRVVEPGGAIRTVDLLQTARGAVFQVLPTAVAFPATRIGTAREYSVNLLNIGSGRARVQYTLLPATGPFRSSRALGPAPVEALNDSLVDTLTFEPTAAGTFAATLAWSFVAAPGEVLCAPMPAPIAVTGTAAP